MIVIHGIGSIRENGKLKTKKHSIGTSTERKIKPSLAADEAIAIW